MITAWFGVFIRGFAMGAADLVPGVSGGTIALITGIYERLILALSRIGLGTVSSIFKGQLSEAWGRVDGTFLLVLMGGMATAIISLAALLNWVLSQYPLPLWACFFGLVLSSVFVLVRAARSDWGRREWALLSAGVVLAVFIGLTQAIQMPVTALSVFFAGSFAICAMILPGISGSFILLLLGMYQPVIAALVSVDVGTIGVFLAGCVLGLLGFSRLLRRLLALAERSTMAILYGFLAGSLITLWPWQVAVSSVTDRHGESRVVQSTPVSPWHYADRVDDPMLALCLVAFLSGALAVVWLTRSGQQYP